MIKRQLLEVVIFPKLFNVLSFYGKGQYSVEISLVAEDQKGAKVYGYPTLLQNKQAKGHENKKATVSVQENIANYTTEQFYVTYNEEVIFLNTLALFKLEIQPSKKYKIYADFKLILTKLKMIKPTNPSNDIRPASSIPMKKIINVDQRRIYFNQIQELNHYKKVIFSDCEYFSILDVFMGTFSLGAKFRLNPYQLTQFSCFKIQEKTKYHLEADRRRDGLLDIDRGRMIKETSKMTLEQFYQHMMTNASRSYNHVKKIYKDFVKLIPEAILGRIHQNITQNNLSIITTFRNRHDLQNYYETKDQFVLFLRIYEEVSEVYFYVCFIWKYFLRNLLLIPVKAFTQATKESFEKENNYKEVSMIAFHSIIDEESRYQQHKTFLEKRKQILENMIFYEDDDVHHPFLMIEGFQQESTAPSKNSDIQSLMIFVHGYQGSDYDLEKAKNYLNLYNGTCYGLLVKSIQNDMDENIEKLGEKLASEIKMHINNSLNSYKKINFIGYSLGGVIIREALKYLEQHKEKMNFLITFASPHLGVSVGDNYLVSTGIWYLINVEKVKNLRQLNCQTLEESNQVLLKKLSECQCLKWFKKFIVVSSKQDNFVPHHSSRIQDGNSNTQIQQMAKNIRKRVKKMERIEVWFDVQHDIKMVDKMLGRRAHVQFLENRIFLDSFFRLYASQF